jgi:predicted aspartyl protease
MTLTRRASLAILALCATAISARAEDCPPLSYITGVPMAAEEDSVPIIPVVINDVTKRMMIDTGGVVSQLSPTTVQEFSLQETSSPLETYDVSGNTSQKAVRAATFQFGAFHFHDSQFQVSTRDIGKLAGLIAQSFLIRYDLDLDFSGHRLNLFSPKHCEGAVIYWPEKTVGVVPITWQKGQMTVPVTIDGKTVSGIIDTGTSRTTMNLDTARWAFGLTPEMLGPPLSGHPNGDQKVDMYDHVFSTLTFGDITVKNVRTHIMPDRVGSQVHEYKPGSRLSSHDLSLPEVIIGMNVLSKLHVYIAFKERKLYVTPPSSDAGKTLPPVVDYAAVKP